MSVSVADSDRLSDFSDHCGALSFSEACEKLRSGNFALDDVFVAGQGLTEIEKIGMEAVPLSAAPSNCSRSGVATTCPLRRR